jgi:hypothetical protein
MSASLGIVQNSSFTSHTTSDSVNSNSLMPLRKKTQIMPHKLNPEARFQSMNSDIKFINITVLASALSREQLWR